MAYDVELFRGCVALLTAGTGLDRDVDAAAARYILGCLQATAEASTFMARLLAEETELEDHVTKLASFVGTSVTFSALDAAEQERLRRQLELMTQYLQVLRERIAALK